MAAAGLRHRPHGGELVNERVVYLCGARRTPTGRDLTTSDQDAPIEQRGGGMMNPGHGHRAVARAEGAGCRVEELGGRQRLEEPRPTRDEHRAIREERGGG